MSRPRTPRTRPSPSAAKGAGRYGLVLCHGFPAEPLGAKLTGQSYPQLADRLAADTGWVVSTFNFRGAGDSQGDFSLGGWLTDLKSAIDDLSGGRFGINLVTGSFLDEYTHISGTDTRIAGGRLSPSRGASVRARSNTR